MATQSSDDEEADPGAFMWIEGDSLAPPCQSDRDVVAKIVEIACLTCDDVLFDLGCGDGRICIEAAKRFGARARGVEIEEFLIERFRRLVAVKDLQQLVSVSHGDLLEEDLSDATVIVTYLLPEALEQLSAKLIKLLNQPDKNVRIICNTWGIRDLTPDERHDTGPYGNVPLFVYRSSSRESKES
uniref:Methyltransferase domain-containing protein n=1 Tax=Hyaloperonospora arabidopsidis (strain Emoy2) TaxID=559515 RepID=M4BRJ3_HYAAE